jgi:uracil-DNA glycosylase
VGGTWRCANQLTAREEGVGSALHTCATRYLAAVLASSRARVVVVAGRKAAEAIALVFEIPTQPLGTVVGPSAVAGEERLLLYLPHPGWLLRNETQAEALTLPRVVKPVELQKLQAAVAV